jgi:hypothetical protein
LNKKHICSICHKEIVDINYLLFLPPDGREVHSKCLNLKEYKKQYKETIYSRKKLTHRHMRDTLRMALVLEEKMKNILPDLSKQIKEYKDFITITEQ